MNVMSGRQRRLWLLLGRYRSVFVNSVRAAIRKGLVFSITIGKDYGMGGAKIGRNGSSIGVNFIYIIDFYVFLSGRMSGAQTVCRPDGKIKMKNMKYLSFFMKPILGNWGGVFLGKFGRMKNKR